MLDITLSNIIPKNISDEYVSSSSIWDKEITFKQSQFYLIRSVSGRGKSTLINYLSGLKSDYHGFQMHNEVKCTNFDPSYWIDKRKDDIGLVNQDLKLIKELTVFENLLLKLELTNITTSDIIDKYLIDFGIDNLKNKKCIFLSMGQQQRVAIIRSLLQPFKWLLLDEPFSHLDEKNKTNALEIIVNKAKKQKAGIILTSLNLSDKLNLFKTFDL